MAGRIKLLGKPAILDGDGQGQSVRGHQAWALLARVILAPHPLDRRTLSAELFSDSVDPLGSLRWCLASLRKALNSSDCLIGDPVELRMPPGLELDVWLLERDTLAVEDMEPLLNGIDPQSGPEFSTWLLVERARIAAVIDGRIRSETMRALAIQNYGHAIRLAELAVRRDVYDESAHVLLVKGLALAGKPSAALKHVEATERLFRDELGTAPSPALRSAARLSVASPPRGISPEAHVKSLIRFGAGALIAGAVDAGIETLRRAVSEADKTGDKHLFAAATLKLGKGLVHSVRGFDDEGSVLLRQCTEIARSRGYEKIAADGFTELGYVEALAGRRPVADQYLHQALEFARDADDLAGIHSVMAFNLVDWGKVGSGLEHYSISLEHARTAGNRRSEIWSLGPGARGQLAAGNLDVAEAWLHDCLGLVDEVHWVAFRPWPVAVMGEIRLRRQEAPAGLRAALEEAYALSCQLRDPCWEAAAARSLALTFTADGDLASAAQWLDEAYKRCIRETDPYVGLQVEILANRVETNQRLGRMDLAVPLSREWIALAARAYMDDHVGRAAAFLAKGDSA
ncbi:BTAD domain-containing putative transcriptional regulator [Ensifer aridi]|uniref:BTAD domain-containing putative transcriptional regulator n=1 Tax=Ensifer aridi TaxID=1708715 RepID=UPI000A11287B|nr:BTAD domain-containing putative transcriptional regulator [Ensifer aridi]